MHKRLGVAPEQGEEGSDERKVAGSR
jgi:hypothetical protein